MLEPYIGKWMRVTGTITDIYPNAVALRTKEGKLDPGDLLFDVILLVDEEWKDRFHILERKRKISVIGTFQEVETSSITLHHAELATNDEAAS
jgi:hypothetical protein